MGNWIAEQAKASVLPHEFGVFVRSAAQLNRAQAAVKKAGMAFKIPRLAMWVHATDTVLGVLRR